MMHYLLVSVSLLKSCNFHYLLLVCKQQLCGLCTRCGILPPLLALAAFSPTPCSSDRSAEGPQEELGWWSPSPRLGASGKLACAMLQLCPCLAISCCDVVTWIPGLSLITTDLCGHRSCGWTWSLLFIFVRCEIATLKWCNYSSHLAVTLCIWFTFPLGSPTSTAPQQ